MIKRKLKILFRWQFALLLLAFPSKLEAQEQSPITIEEAISKAQQGNKDLQLSAFDEKIATEQQRQTLSFYLPQISASYSAMATNNPLNAFGFTLQQESITQNDFNPTLLNHPSTTYNVVAQLEVRQPILNIDMLFQRKAAAKQSELYRYKSLRTQEYVKFEVQRSFMMLQFAFQAQKVLQEALSAARAVYDFTQNRYNQGLLQKYDLLNTQVQVTTLETKLSEAQSSIQNASDQLALLIGAPKNLTYIPQGTWEQQEASSDLTLSDNRADFLALSSAIEATKYGVRSSQASLLPRINAFASYQYNNPGIKDFNNGSYLAGIQLSWNLFNGMRTAHTIKEKQLSSTKLQVELSKQKEQATAEIDKTRRALTDSKIKIISQKKAVEQSEESFRILKNRYEKGLTNTTDILIGQAQVAQQRLMLEQAILERNVGQAYLQFLTSAISK